MDNPVSLLRREGLSHHHLEVIGRRDLKVPVVLRTTHPHTNPARRKRALEAVPGKGCCLSHK